jgi:hypothetical protein
VFEDEGGEAGALEKAMFSQGLSCNLHRTISGSLFYFLLAMGTIDVYRPRIIIHGPIGMGQGYIGAATLHHLEGYHVQSLRLRTLMSSSTRVHDTDHISTATSLMFSLFYFLDDRGSDCPTTTNPRLSTYPPSLGSVPPSPKHRGQRYTPCSIPY